MAQRGPDATAAVKYSYDYDRFGNRWQQQILAGTGYGGQLDFNTANNRVTSTGFAYDASGNQATTGQGSPTFSYDFENFLKTVGSSISYKVDAQGRRVRKTVNGVMTDYFYLGAVVISEKQGSNWTDYIFFGGQRVALNTGSDLSTAKFLHTNHPGSTRVCPDANGNAAGACGYEPFREFTGGASACTIPSNYRFAGMEFDSDTGLYHNRFSGFWSPVDTTGVPTTDRQYDPTQGRWLSVEPLLRFEADPQARTRFGDCRCLGRSLG